MALPPLTMGLSSASGASASSISTSSAQQSIAFNPNVIISSPESNFRPDQTTTPTFANTPNIYGGAATEATSKGFGPGEQGRSGLQPTSYLPASNYAGAGPYDPGLSGLRSEVLAKGGDPRGIVESLGLSNGTLALAVGGVLLLGVIYWKFGR